MRPKISNKKTEAEEGFAMLKTQREERNKTDARSGGGGALAPGSELRAGLRRRGRQVFGGTGNGGRAEGEEGMGTAAPRSGSQKTPEGKRVVARNVWRTGSAAYSERMGSDDGGVETFGDRQRESGGGMESSGVAEEEKREGTAVPRRRSKRPPKSMGVVG